MCAGCHQVNLKPHFLINEVGSFIYGHGYLLNWFGGCSIRMTTYQKINLGVKGFADADFNNM